MQKEEFNLTQQEQACLLLIQEGFNDIPKEIFTEDVKDRLIALKLVQFDDNPKIGWSITPLGIRAVNTKIAIKYPLHTKLTSYNNVIQTMSDEAKDALLCSQINNHFFDDVPVRTLRVLIQSMIDKGLYRKFGKTLKDKLAKVLSKDNL
jgi:hypothetical protein